MTTELIAVITLCALICALIGVMVWHALEMRGFKDLAVIAARRLGQRVEAGDVAHAILATPLTAAAQSEARQRLIAEWTAARDAEPEGSPRRTAYDNRLKEVGAE